MSRLAEQTKPRTSQVHNQDIMTRATKTRSRRATEPSGPMVGRLSCCEWTRRRRCDPMFSRQPALLGEQSNSAQSVVLGRSSSVRVPSTLPSSGFDTSGCRSMVGQPAQRETTYSRWRSARWRPGMSGTRLRRAWPAAVYRVVYLYLWSLVGNLV